MKARIFWLAALWTFFCVLSGCGGSAPAYEDGVFSGRSGADDTGAYGEVTVTVTDGVITDCRFVTWQEDGSPKDEEYGKVNGAISNQAYYNSAQLAVRAMERYAEQFVEVKTLDEVDAITGATISHDQFIEAAEEALAGA
ncbi:MAG: FMN-binding protein [Gracilibacteraceae bacterium]|jgi:major membrane immunogen (membrane-anchored lipoprotein)|nr:FMN-binding protein [Gracilibacteraceae bacterium]